MEIKIKNPISNYINRYVLTVYYMHGDDDGNTDIIETYSPETLEDLKRDLGFLNRLKSSRYSREYHKILKDFDEETRETLEEAFMVTDMTCGDHLAKVTGFDVVYYDENGAGYNTELIFE